MRCKKFYDIISNEYIDESLDWSIFAVFKNNKKIKRNKFVAVKLLLILIVLFSISCGYPENDKYIESLCVNQKFVKPKRGYDLVTETKEFKEYIVAGNRHIRYILVQNDTIISISMYRHNWK